MITWYDEEMNEIKEGSHLFDGGDQIGNVVYEWGHYWLNVNGKKTRLIEMSHDAIGNNAAVLFDFSVITVC